MELQLEAIGQHVLKHDVEVAHFVRMLRFRHDVEAGRVDPIWAPGDLDVGDLVHFPNHRFQRGVAGYVGSAGYRADARPLAGRRHGLGLFHRRYLEAQCAGVAIRRVGLLGAPDPARPGRRQNCHSSQKTRETEFHESSVSPDAWVR